MTRSVWAHYRWDGSYIFKLGYGILIYGFTLINARHLLNIFIFRFVRNNPEEIKGQITQSAKYVYTVSAGQDIAFTIAIVPLAILTGSIYLYGALIAGVSMAVTHIGWYRAFKKNKEISTNSDTNRRKSGRLLKKLKLCFLILLIVIFIGNEGYQIYLNKTFAKEEIDAAFEPITSKYGVKIVYEIGDDFFSPHVAAGPSHYSKVEPIRHRILMRYPDLLQKAFAKYSVEVIKKYLSAIHFAKEIDANGYKYNGSHDEYRLVVYLVDNGKNDNQAMGTFHHEFSSLLLDKHQVNFYSWKDHHPSNFQYLSEIHDSWEKIDKARKEFTDDDCYENGIVVNYGLTHVINAFNEYSEMIFTYPKKFRQIMDQHPRVRGKFLVWLKFYQKIDPIFTEDYLFGR